MTVSKNKNTFSFGIAISEPRNQFLSAIKPIFKIFWLEFILEWELIIKILHLSLTFVLEKMKKWDFNSFGQIIKEPQNTGLWSYWFESLDEKFIPGKNHKQSWRIAISYHTITDAVARDRFEIPLFKLDEHPKQSDWIRHRANERFWIRATVIGRSFPETVRKHNDKLIDNVTNPEMEFSEDQISGQIEISTNRLTLQNTRIRINSSGFKLYGLANPKYCPCINYTV